MSQDLLFLIVLLLLLLLLPNKHIFKLTLTLHHSHSLGAPRIGLPKYDWWNEALHGVAFSPGVHFATPNNNTEFTSATSFPCPITLSAAFDDQLVEDVGRHIGAEARAYANAGRSGVDFWTPNVNPFRDPRWGRGLETPGEDPLRTSLYVRSLLRGMEWASEEQRETRQIVATCKHCKCCPPVVSLQSHEISLFANVLLTLMKLLHTILNAGTA
jgi:beta-glucosidase-like glycosyl hydrolase